jgi:hypothetical protein
MGRPLETGETIMVTIRETFITEHAKDRFERLEKTLQKLKDAKFRISGEMEDLLLEWRRSFIGWRLHLYKKTRRGCDDPVALYWGSFCKPPKERYGPYGKNPRWRKHLKGKLDHASIFKHGADISQEGLVLDFERRAAELNSQFHSVAKALQSAGATYSSWAHRRDWECGDLEFQAPPVLRDLPPQLQSVLGAAWPLFLRMDSLESMRWVLAAQYEADPVWRDLKLVYLRDKKHPYGWLGWRYLGRPLVSIHEGGPGGVSIENLTDRWMRRHRVPHALRPGIAAYEKERRRLTTLHKRYKEPLFRVNRCAGQALARVKEGDPGASVKATAG